MEEKNLKYNNKTELALSALMFFSPLIQKQLKNKKNISVEDKLFIKWFIKIWYINIFMLIISISSQILFYFYKINLLQTFSIISTIILVIVLSIWSVLVISNKQIIKSKDSKEKQNQETNLDLILNYIPIYNIYIRYKKHEFEKPNYNIKESILIWWIVSILILFLPSTNLIIFLILLVIIRIVFLINNISLWEGIEKKIDKLFVKNPEEMRWYLIWNIKICFNKKNVKENIEKNKEEFSLILKINYKQVLVEYILFFLWIAFLLYLWYKNWNTNMIIWAILIATRYIVLILKWKHWTHIPIIKEITNLFFYKNQKNENKN